MKRKSISLGSDLCASCPVGCEQPFCPDGCPYGFFDEDEITLSRLIKQDFEAWRKKFGFPQYDEP